MSSVVRRLENVLIVLFFFSLFMSDILNPERAHHSCFKVICSQVELVVAQFEYRTKI